ncbi:rhomboid family intramembrane serine protease [Algiphilus sp. W345]|uniref:Rhomboid family intramembrane serine protease n=1 Tax=Banduia mediterranea TaxID=3075609 RepID=A0ABU2WFF5_9GAMM|nr:rhomboid family intramembrane serine protease [Algiphilus sp. W345]MDT0496611.1 rhomboid family intramembrane serine protease [Algiphilus sp. W345]
MDDAALDRQPSLPVDVRRSCRNRDGHTRFALPHLCSAISAAIAQSLVTAPAEVPMIGASGANSGVLVAYVLRFPRANLLIALPRKFGTLSVRLPTLLILGLCLTLQRLSEFRRPDAAGAAFRAHIGGFLAGIASNAMLRSDERTGFND